MQGATSNGIVSTEFFNSFLEQKAGTRREDDECLKLLTKRIVVKEELREAALAGRNTEASRSLVNASAQCGLRSCFVVIVRFMRKLD